MSALQDTGLKKRITRDDFLSWGLWNYGGRLGPRVDALFGEQETGSRTPAEVAESTEIAPADRLSLLVRKEVLSQRELGIFAAWCAKRALENERGTGRDPNAEIWQVLEVARRHAKGDATDTELAAAYEAARKARTWGHRGSANPSARKARERAAQMLGGEDELVFQYAVTQAIWAAEEAAIAAAYGGVRVAECAALYAASTAGAAEDEAIKGAYAPAEWAYAAAAWAAESVDSAAQAAWVARDAWAAPEAAVAREEAAAREAAEWAGAVGAAEWAGAAAREASWSPSTAKFTVQWGALDIGAVAARKAAEGAGLAAVARKAAWKKDEFKNSPAAVAAAAAARAAAGAAGNAAGRAAGIYARQKVASGCSPTTAAAQAVTCALRWAAREAAWQAAGAAARRAAREAQVRQLGTMLRHKDQP